MDRDQAPRNVGPNLRSILFETRHQFLLKTGCYEWADLNSGDIQILSILQIVPNFWSALYRVSQKPEPCIKYA